MMRPYERQQTHKFQFTKQLNQPKGRRTKFFAKLSFKKEENFGVKGAF